MSTPTVGRMLDSSARRCVLGVIAVVLGLLLAACGGAEQKAAPKPAPTPIAKLDTVAMQVPRIEFCGLLPRSALTAALGAKQDSVTAYGNGDEQEISGVGKDVLHELGCAWTTTGGVIARAWVFARPIDAAFARKVISSSTRSTRCRAVPGSLFGKPSTTQTCRFPDGSQRVRHAGLFGQTWLTCEIEASDTSAPRLRSRTDAWCVEVANALNTAR